MEPCGISHLKNQDLSCSAIFLAFRHVLRRYRRSAGDTLGSIVVCLLIVSVGEAAPTAAYISLTTVRGTRAKGTQTTRKQDDRGDSGSTGDFRRHLVWRRRRPVVDWNQAAFTITSLCRWPPRPDTPARVHAHVSRLQSFDRQNLQSMTSSL